MNVKNMTDKISVYGATGFIGGTFCRMYSDEVIAIGKKIGNQNQKIFYTLLVQLQITISIAICLSISIQISRF